MKASEKLTIIQSELNAPKGQFNNFGKYKYRSLEDIDGAVKPLLKAHNCTIYLSDEVQQIGDRYYVKATATFIDIESGEMISVSAYARESEIKKGMDSSQITGSASSYARKYAMNGLLLIDDTKDSDTEKPTTTTDKISDKELHVLNKVVEAYSTHEEVLAEFKINKYNDITMDKYGEILNWLKKEKESKNARMLALRNNR